MGELTAGFTFSVRMPISIRVWRSPAPPRSFSLGGSHSTWISVLSSIMTVFGMKEPCVLLGMTFSFLKSDLSACLLHLSFKCCIDESWVVINSVELLNRCPEAILVPSCVRNVTVSFDHHSMVAVAPCTRFAVPHDATMNEIYATLTRGVVIDLSSTADVLISGLSAAVAFLYCVR